MSTLKNQEEMNPLNENTQTGSVEAPSAIKSFSQLDRLKPVLRVVPRDSSPASQPVESESQAEVTTKVPVVRSAPTETFISANKPTEAQIALSEAQTRTDVLLIPSPSRIEKWMSEIASVAQHNRLQLGIGLGLVLLSFSAGYFMSRQPTVSRPTVSAAAPPIAKSINRKVKPATPSSKAALVAPKVKRAPAAKPQKPVLKRAKGRAANR